MLVDTGANSHVIASWVARKVGLPMRALGDVGSDHTGRAVSAYTVEHPAVAIDEWGALADGPMLVTDVPEPIARIGIGAFVSPQWLAAAGDAAGARPGEPGDAHRAVGRRGRRRSTRCRAREHRARAARASARTTASAIKGLAFVLPREHRRARGGPAARHGGAPDGPADDVARRRACSRDARSRARSRCTPRRAS